MGEKVAVQCIRNIERVIDLKTVTSATSALIDTGTFTCIPSIGPSNVSGTEAVLIARPGSPATKRSEAQGLEKKC